LGIDGNFEKHDKDNEEKPHEPIPIQTTPHSSQVMSLNAIANVFLR
jgi:hypothetical protein